MNFFYVFMLSFGIDMRSFKYDLWWYLSEVEEFFMALGEIFNAFQGKFIWMNFSAASNDDGKLIFIQVQGCLKFFLENFSNKDVNFIYRAKFQKFMNL